MKERAICELKFILVHVIIDIFQLFWSEFCQRSKRQQNSSRISVGILTGQCEKITYLSKQQTQQVIKQTQTLYPLVFGNMSQIPVKTVSSRANSESKPNKNSMKKNNIDHMTDKGICVTASGQTTNANPCPPRTTSSIVSQPPLKKSY